VVALRLNSGFVPHLGLLRAKGHIFAKEFYIIDIMTFFIYQRKGKRRREPLRMGYGGAEAGPDESRATLASHFQLDRLSIRFKKPAAGGGAMESEAGSAGPPRPIEDIPRQAVTNEPSSRSGGESILTWRSLQKIDASPGGCS